MHKLRLVRIGILLGFSLLGFGLLGSAAEPSASPLTLLTARDGKLFDGDQEFRFVSFNIPNLHQVEDEFDFLRGAIWRWPTEFEIDDAFATINQLGGRVVRSYVLSVKRDDSNMGDVVHVRAPGEFNEEAFVALDRVLAAANRHGVRVMVPFVDNWRWWGGVEQYAGFRGKPAEAFWTDPQIRADFKRTIEFVINRRNTISGTLYRDDPAIFGWETGNEISAPAEWTADIAAYIKQLDSKHLVIDGDSLRGVRAASLANPHVDVVTQHFYPEEGVSPAAVVRESMAKINRQKSYFVGEIGFLPTAEIAATIEAVKETGASGLLAWSIRYRREGGGFFWHSEPASEGKYKAYHWPGFATGERYDEQNLLRVMRDGAFAIRGLPTPKLAAPSAPELLPIDDPAHITWRGATGSESYRLERARSAEGPWVIVASGVTETDTQYRPVSGDSTALIGEPAYYRVVAVNSAGESAPSNVVGPIRAEHRTLIDELVNDELAARVTGEHEWVTADARRVQEDAHRLALSPGAAVSYEVGLPIREVRLWMFATSGDEKLNVSAIDDDGNASPIELSREQGPAAAGDYNYLTPVLLSGKVTPSARQLTIARPGAADGTKPGELQLSRVEIASGSSAEAPATSRAPVNPAILLLNDEWLAKAPELVRRAADLGATQVNFVVTVHAKLNEDRTVREFGLMHTSPRYRFVPMDDALHGKLRTQWRAAFTAAREAGLEIAVLPHIDAAWPNDVWRNWIDFDPFAKTKGYSFYDLVLEPVAEILSELENPGEVTLCVGGEMGRSLFTYPQAYHEVLTKWRAMPAPHDAEKRAWRLGVSLNHSGVAGEDPPSAANVADVQKFLEESDFLGFSNYRPVTPAPGVREFAGHVDQFVGELEGLGLTLPPNLPLEFSEIGLGGGHDGEPTSDPALACQSPWEGAARLSDNPWRSPEMTQLRRRYHQSLLEFMATQPARRSVTVAYFWSMGSWDPQGIESPGSGDEMIIEAVRRHNAGE